MVKRTSKRTKLRIAKRKPRNNVTALGRALRTLGGLGGGAVGGIVGAPISGSTVGTGLGAMLSKWMGQGDYKISSNSLVSSFKGSGTIPMMHKNSQTLTVRHKECLGDVITSSTTGAFNVTGYPINPGMVQTFPWLSKIAQSYQEYTIKGMIVHFNSTSGESVASTNTALGTVMMYTDYKAGNQQPFSKSELLNEYFSCDAKFSQSFAHPIECDPKENPYKVQYVRATSIPSNEDLKTYDLGTLYVATQGGQAANVNIGELWITYEIELRKPRANVFDSVNTPSALWNVSSSTTPTTFVNNATATFNNYGFYLTPASNAVVVVLPPGSAGYWILTATFFQLTAGTASLQTPAMSNAVLTNYYNYVNPSTTTNGFLSYSFAVLDSSKAASVSISMTAWPTTASVLLSLTPFARY